MVTKLISLPELEELLPTFGNDDRRGFVNALNGGCYTNSVNSKGKEILLKLCLNIGSYDLYDISLFYNYRLVRFLLSNISGSWKTHILMETATTDSNVGKFSVLHSYDKLYIKYPPAETTLHLYNIKKILGQNLNIYGNSVEISADDVSGLTEIKV